MPQRESAQPGRSDPAERELLRRLVAGEFRAWQEFVERYQAVVHSAARRTAETCRIVLGQSDLEDVTAEVFAALIANDYAALRRFEGRSRLSTWLTVLARRHALRYSRRKYRSDRKRLRTDSGMADGQQGPLAQLIGSEESKQLRTAVRQLNDADRHLLSLYYDQQLGYAEIGRRLGIAENSVGSRIQRLHKRIQRIVRRHHPGDGNTGLPSRREGRE